MDEVTTVVTIQPSASSPIYQTTIMMNQTCEMHLEGQIDTSSSLPSSEITLPRQQTLIQSPLQDVVTSRDETESQVANQKQPTEHELAIKGQSAEWKETPFYRNPFLEFERRKPIGDKAVRREEGKRDLTKTKYIFPVSESQEDDDDEQEEIDANLGPLSSATGRLYTLAKATAAETRIYPSIYRPTQKGDPVNEQVVLNRARLDRIK